MSSVIGGFLSQELDVATPERDELNLSRFGIPKEVIF